MSHHTRGAAGIRCWLLAFVLLALLILQGSAEAQRPRGGGRRPPGIERPRRGPPHERLRREPPHDLRPERVREAIEITDRRIEHAQSVASSPPPAAEELAAARDLQRRATGAFDGRELGQALRFTMDARRRADRAIALVQGLPDPDRVFGQLGRTQDLLARAQDRIAGCTVPRARSLLGSALDTQRRADEAARSGRHLAALRLTIRAREQGHGALRACGHEEQAGDPAERALERTDRLIQEVSGRLERRSDTRAREQFDRAVEIQIRARRAHRERRSAESIELTNSARAHAQRAAQRLGVDDL